MDKSVLISIRPKWCEKITSGEKTIEVRKTRPKLDTPFRCYIYCTVEMAGYDALWVLDTPTREKYSLMAVSAYLETPEGANKGNGKVIGEFTCDRIYKIDKDSTDFLFKAGGLSVYKQAAEEKCGLRVAMTDDELHGYLGHCQGYGWHISGLRIYDAPRELSEFSPVCRYKNDDGSCQSRRVACSYQKYDYSPDGSINLVECGRTLERPPQSWCYVLEDYHA